MNFCIRSCAVTVGLILITGLPEPSAAAEEWPAQPIHFIVPYAPGGGMDITARLAGEHLAKKLKASVIVENRPGASTTIATSYVVRAAPDGYTLLFTDSTHGANPALFKSLPYKTMDDLDSVVLLTQTPAVLVVRPSLNVSSVPELVALAKKQPGKLNYASAGVGTVQHLGAELLKREAGIDIVQIAYSGAAPALNALLGEQVDLMFIPPTTLAQYLNTGKLKALAVANDHRLILMPDTPTFAEMGYPGVMASASVGVRVPKGTPAGVISRLNEAFNATLQEPDVQEKIRSWGAIAVGGSPKAFTDYLNTEISRWSKTLTPSMALQ